jgi:hypothetical protein
MTFKVNIKNLVLGIVIGIVVLLTVGAVSRNNNPGQYQVSIAANARNVFYAKIHTGTGEIETWQSAITSVPTRRK